MKRVAHLSVVAAFCFVLAGCGDGVDPLMPPETVGNVGSSSNLGGDGLPVQQPGESYGHSSESLVGTLAQQANGCWTADLGDLPRLVVFPMGYSKPADGGSVMQGPDGTTIRSGMAFDAKGGIVPAQGFPGVPDGYWGNYLTFCDPELQEFLVLDSISPAFRPDDLSDDELAAMLTDADLSVAWGCGLGFTVSSEDQRVALFVAPLDSGSVIEPPVSFPDDQWYGVVMIGKNLMVNHCNDAIEGWKPVPIVAGQWPLVAGALDFEPPAVQGKCSAGEPVTASLRGIEIETPAGVINLGDLDLVNDAYGCFAG
ncbi:MAG: hypothetical protein P1T08_11940 [Acidimicrobiia bacterium]|nr:hypothetical protein [Acidimicrobiia bacterium]